MIHPRKLIRLLKAGSGAPSTADERAQERQRRVVLSGLTSMLAKLISVATTLLTIPLTLHYLGSERFGMWMTISSFMAMMSFADMGIGNGAVNQVANANGRDDKLAIKQIVSSGVCALGAVALALLATLVIIYPRIDWPSLFNVRTTVAMAEAGPAFLTVALMFIANIPLGIFGRVQAGLQQSFHVSLFQCVGSMAGLSGVLLAVWARAPLPTLVAALAAGPLVTGLASSILYLRAGNSEIRPALQHVSIPVICRILKTGGLFFGLQILAAVTYTSDNVVIASLLGAASVTLYAIPDKLFSQIPMLMGMFLAPLWPAYGEALARGDAAWVRRTVRRSLSMAVGVAALLSGTTWLAAPWIFSLWVGPDFAVPSGLLLGLALWKIVEVICLSLAVFLNGANVVKTQLLLGLLTAGAAIGGKIVCVGGLGEFSGFGVAAIPWVSLAAHLMFILVPYAFLLPRLPQWQGRGNPRSVT